MFSDISHCCLLQNSAFVVDGTNISRESSPKVPHRSPFKIQNCKSPPRGSCSKISSYSVGAEKEALEKLKKRDRASKEHLNAVVAVDGWSLLPASVDLGSPPPVKEMPLETEEASLEEMMDWFTPLPSLLSPISSPYIKVCPTGMFPYKRIRWDLKNSCLFFLFACI